MNLKPLLRTLLMVITILSTNKVIAGLKFTPCDVAQLKGTINSVNVTNCDPNDIHMETCIFRKGTNVTIRTSFTPHETIDNLKIKISGIIYGVEIPWPITNTNACNYGLTCPIYKDQENYFVISMFIWNHYPSLPVTVRLRLEDSHKKPFYCIQFPAKIQSQ